MKVFIEKIDPPPPPAPLTDEEELTSKLEALASDDRWVKNIIEALAGVIRDMKH